MILAKLRGGLSNQMFQYAAALRLARHHHTDVRIDASWYAAIPDGATPRRYELDRLRISGQLATSWETLGTDGVRNTPWRWKPAAVWRKLRPRYRYVEETRFGFDPRILDLPDGVCLYGYWVSEKYFTDEKEAVRREFTFRAPPDPANHDWLRLLASVNSVAVHVRRGDYVANPHVTGIHGLCGPDYYAKAAAHMRAILHEPVYFVFSDDLDWAKANLSLAGDTFFVDTNRGDSSAEDLRLMAGSRHNIIANSGFSWWGAWLNTNRDKAVIAPKRWMRDLSYDTSAVIPDGWTQL